jgi:membrane protein involved in colicin uptake
MKHTALLLLVSVITSFVTRADTIVLKSGQTMDATVLSTDGQTLNVEVEYGTMRIPMALVKNIEKATPEEIARREEEKQAERELAAEMHAEGKVLYRGKWIDEEEKQKIEEKLADERKKKAEEKAAAKKKKEEELAKKKAEDLKRRQEALQRQQTQENEDPRARRFNRNRRNRDDENNNYGNTNYGNTNYGNGYQNQINNAVDQYSRYRSR